MKNLRLFLTIIIGCFLAVSQITCGGGGGGSASGGGDGTGGGATLDIGKVEPLDPSKIITDPATGQEVVNDQILITFKEGVSESSVNAKIASINGEIVGYIKGMNDYQVRIKGNPTLDQLKALIEQLNNDPDVEAAMLNTLSTNERIMPSKTPDSNMDPKWFEGPLNWDSWDESNPGGRNWGLEAIQALSAWDYNGEMQTVRIGVIDSGFQLDHEDLNIPANNAQNTASGGTMVADDHGTHVAGIIGAESNDSNGITGIVWNKELFVFWQGSVDRNLLKYSQSFEVKYGLVYLLERGCKIINTSFGAWPKRNLGRDPSDSNPDDVKNYIEKPRNYWTSFLNRLVNKGYNFLIIHSAGNEKIDAKWKGYFGSIDDANLRKRITLVGSIKRSGILDMIRNWTTNPYTFSTFSNYGEKVDIVAPGEDIYSTVTDNGYSTLSGTSMAAPHVTGVAALVWAINPNLTAEQVKNIVVGMSDRPVTHKGRPYNIVNARASVEKARSEQATQPIPQPPTGILIGKVVDAITREGIDEALVSVFKGTSYEIYTASTASTVDGSYELILEPGTYKIFVSKDNYISVFSYKTITEGVTTYDAILQAVPTSHSGNGCIGGNIKNAFTGQGVSGLTISFRNGIDAVSGDIAGSTTTGANGYYSITLPAGNYTGEITGSGYSTSYLLVVSIGGYQCNASTDDQNGSVTPIIPAGQTRIILTWGENPWDLDSHLTGPLPDGSRFHLYYPYAETNAGSPWPQYAKLDLDDVTSYGPETTTIYQQINGVYRFSVHDYTNRHSSSSYALSNSGAQVRVYRGSNLVATFNVPANQGGTLWTVFEMSGNTINPINTMSYESAPTIVREILGSSAGSFKTDAELIRNLPDKR